MKKISMVFLTLMVASASIISAPLVTLSGSALSGISGYKQQKGQPFKGQFESAANVVVGLELSPQVSAEVDLGLGIDPNQSGFVQGAELFGIRISMAPKGLYDTTISLGAIPVPYGQFSETQTDNSSVPSHFIFNDVGYALLNQGNALSDFSANGVSTTTPVAGNKGRVNLMVFNGTDDNATNTDQGFGVAARYINDTLINNVSMSISAMNVNDSGNSNAINANTTGYMADVKTSVFGSELGGYVSLLTLDDTNASTKDHVTAMMGYAAKRFDKVTLAGRYSVVKPEDFDGNGTGGTSALPVIGLGDVPYSDVDTTRIQASAIFHLEDSLNLHNEIIFDTYGENRTDYNNTAVLSYASIAF